MHESCINPNSAVNTNIMSHNVARTSNLGNQMLGVSLGMGFVAAALTQGLTQGVMYLGLRKILFCLIVLLTVGNLLSHLGVGRHQRPSRLVPPPVQVKNSGLDRKVAHSPQRRRRAYQLASPPGCGAAMRMWCSS